MMATSQGGVRVLLCIVNGRCRVMGCLMLMREKITVFSSCTHTNHACRVNVVSAPVES